MKIVRWTGHHGPEIRELIHRAWEGEHLLILHPPGVDDVSFLPLLEKTDFPDEPVFGLFSTGTTGRKLVLYSRENVLSSLKGILSFFDDKRLTSIFCYPQPFHTFGLVLGYLHAIICRRELITVDGPYGAAYHDAWARTAGPGTLTLGTPTHFKDLLAHVKAPPATYSSIIGAAKVEAALWRDCRDRLRIAEPSIGYGATEACPGITHLPPGREPREDGEIGVALPQLRVRILDEGIEFSGPSLCLGIVSGDAIEFPKTLVIPDRVTKREDGVLVYRGRAGLVLNRGGEKFALEEMEGALKSQLRVDAICVALPDDRLGEELGVLAEGDTSRDAVFRLLKENFRREFNPRYFQTVPTLPRNESAKVDRHRATEILACCR